MRVLTLNVWCEPPQRKKRIQDATSYILKVLPDIIYLQELVAGDSRRYLRKHLGKEYVIFYSKDDTKFPPFAFVPFVLIFLSTLLIFQFNIRKSILLSLFASPKCVSWFVSWKLSQRISDVDLMGTGILIRKNILPRNPVIECISKPFDHKSRGYPIPNSLRPYNLLEYWFQHSFARPGCLLLRCNTKNVGSLVLANCHLVTSRPGHTSNSRRVEQVKKVLDWVNDFVPNKSSCSKEKLIIVGGDFNAVPSGREQKTLNDAGFIESFQGNPEVTWDPISNDFTSWDHEPPSQLDYIYIKSNAFEISNSRIVFDGTKTGGSIVSDHYGIETTLKRTRRERETNSTLLYRKAAL